MSTRGRTVRVGTRGSDLAVRQAATIKETLEQRRLSVDLVEVETRGDRPPHARGDGAGGPPRGGDGGHIQPPPGGTATRTAT